VSLEGKVMLNVEGQSQIPFLTTCHAHSCPGSICLWIGPYVANSLVIIALQTSLRVGRVSWHFRFRHFISSTSVNYFHYA